MVIWSTFCLFFRFESMNQLGKKLHYLDDFICKPYTVIDSSLNAPSLNEKTGKQLALMIKHYEEGQLTSVLNFLKKGWLHLYFMLDLYNGSYLKIKK
jgi:hypothetical protein